MMATVDAASRYNHITVFEIVLGALVDNRSINEFTFGGPAFNLVDRKNMQ